MLFCTYNEARVGLVNTFCAEFLDTHTEISQHPHRLVILSDRSAAQGVEGPAFVFSVEIYLAALKQQI
jgi:hypothetical protein